MNYSYTVNEIIMLSKKTSFIKTEYDSYDSIPLEIK